MDIKAADIMFEIKDIGEGECTLMSRPFNGRQIYILMEYIPENMRQPMISRAEHSMQQVVQLYTTEYKERLDRMIRELHAIPPAELGSGDISEYAHGLILDDMVSDFDIVFYNN
jgi:hypothetical protein